MSGGDWKAMFKAIQEGDYELVSYYLKMGVDPNYQHPEYMAAPLIESFRFDHFDIMQLLLEHGAEPNIREVMGGESAMEIAILLKKHKAINLLNKYLNK